MKKISIAIALMLLLGFSVVEESSAQYARRPVRRVYSRWAVRVQNNATRRVRNINVNASSDMAARRRALQLARAQWRPNHRGFRVISARRIHR